MLPCHRPRLQGKGWEGVKGGFMGFETLKCLELLVNLRPEPQTRWVGCTRECYHPTKYEPQPARLARVMGAEVQNWQELLQSGLVWSGPVRSGYGNGVLHPESRAKFQPRCPIGDPPPHTHTRQEDKPFGSPPGVNDKRNTCQQQQQQAKTGVATQGGNVTCIPLIDAVEKQS